MKENTVLLQVELPKKIIKSAEDLGITKEKLSETMKRFAILEVTSHQSKLNKEDIEKISNKIKAAAWKKTKLRQKI